LISIRADSPAREIRADDLVEVCIALVNLSLGLECGVSGIIWRDPVRFGVSKVGCMVLDLVVDCRGYNLAVYHKSRDDGVILGRWLNLCVSAHLVALSFYLVWLWWVELTQKIPVWVFQCCGI
jgi:hypothetical protein